MRKLAIIAALVFLTACKTLTPQQLEWKREDIVECTLDLVDEKAIESYNFSAAGRVIATIGQVGGPCASPRWKWKIQHGELVISGGFWAERRPTLIKRSNSEYVTESFWGKKLLFRVTRK